MDNNRVPNGKAYVARSVNMYLPAYRDNAIGAVWVRRAVRQGGTAWGEPSKWVSEWSTVGVVQDTFIPNKESE